MDSRIFLTNLPPRFSEALLRRHLPDHPLAVISIVRDPEGVGSVALIQPVNATESHMIERRVRSLTVGGRRIGVVLGESREGKSLEQAFWRQRTKEFDDL